jgi:non-reducing end alpha-L-arabinofuranosidase
MNTPARRGTRFRRLRTALGAPVALAIALLAAVFGLAAPAQATGTLPCDIYAAASTPCVAAHSMVRALYSAYTGNLYQVQRASDSTTANIPVLSAGGYADAAAQDTFCANTTCTISKIYDQSANHNDLTLEAPGSASGGISIPASASAVQVTVGGHRAYGLYVTPGVGYKDASTTGVPTNGAAESMYMVASGTHSNSMCCFDYGNTETGGAALGNGHMDALNLSSMNYWNAPGAGPWIQADFENGIYPGAGPSYNPSNTGNSTPFVTAMLENNGSTTWGLKGGDAQSGSLSTLYSGGFPPGYGPMHQEGAIILGTGGDGTHVGVGTFFEGAMTAGVPSASADNSVQASIVAAGYQTTDGTLTPGSASSLRATTSCCTASYVSTPLTTGVLAPMTATSQDAAMNGATYMIRKGLAGTGCVSFESRDRPGMFLRHSAFTIYLNPNDGTTLFAQDATYCPQPGLNGQGTSFASYNYPSRYLRHYNSGIYVASNGGANAFDTTTSWTDDVSFAVSAPWEAYEVGSLNDDAHFSLRATSPCCSDTFVRHQNGATYISPITTASPLDDKQDATFIAHKGLAASPCSSFESSNFPGYYLRHSGFQLVLSYNDGSTQFKQDATFCALSGRNGQGLSFASYNYPNRFIRHYNGTVYLAADGGPNAWDTATDWTDDTSFVVSPRWTP